VFRCVFGITHKKVKIRENAGREKNLKKGDDMVKRVMHFFHIKHSNSMALWEHGTQERMEGKRYFAENT